MLLRRTEDNIPTSIFILLFVIFLLSLFGSWREPNNKRSAATATTDSGVTGSSSKKTAHAQGR